MTKAQIPPLNTSLSLVAKSTTYTAVSGDYVVATGSWTLTLPAAAAGRMVGVKSINGDGAAPLTVTTPGGAGSIIGPGIGAGAFVLKLGTPGSYVLLQCDGTNWHVIAGAMDTGWIAFPYAANMLDFGGGYTGGGYRKLGELVYLRGLIKKVGGAAPINGEGIGTLPAGFQPNGTLYGYHVWCTSAAGNSAHMLQVATNGLCTIENNLGNLWNGTFCAINGVVFSVS